MTNFPRITADTYYQPNGHGPQDEIAQAVQSALEAANNGTASQLTFERLNDLERELGGDNPYFDADRDSLEAAIAAAHRPEIMAPHGAQSNA